MLLNRRNILAGAGIAGIATAFPALATGTPAAPGDAEAVRTLAAIAEEMLAAFPENATTLGIDTGKRTGLKSTLTDRSVAADAGQRSKAGSRLRQLTAIDRSTLSPQVALDVDVTQAAYQLAHDGWEALPGGDVAILNQNVSYRSTPYIVSQGTGAFAEVPDMMESKHEIATRADADAYLARLEAYAASLDAETARIVADAGKNMVLPRFLLDITASQLNAAATQKVDEWSLIRSFATKAEKAGVAGAWSDSATTIATGKIAPALARQAAALTGLRDKAGDTPGMWKLPEAERAYAWLVEAGTTTRRTPEEVHQSGLEQVAKLSAEMDVLLKAQGLTKGSVGARLAELGKRPDLLYPNTNAGRAELLGYLNRTVANIRGKMPQVFGKVVEGKLIVKRVPVSIEGGAPNAYAGAGSIDGKTPGNFYINLKDTSIWPRFALPTLVSHEGIPGHVWQGEYTFSLPLIRTLLAFNAYSEGWALYAEQLTDEVGVYAEDPLAHLGYLQSMNFRASRLVADTGLHHKRWTMEQAMRWFGEATGYTASQCRSELNRYCAWPGQALGYKTGHNEINRLRSKAKATLGAKFDVKKFNDLVVGVGGVPLSVLERVVDNWAIAATA
ncbi:DUF885 family protein [Sphingomonas sp. So64.6b]|uniref:DUF885 domain-containing protein n=1 Tax=Sphingomonas sp. So64.6b TaxID=2997354 RepID=UPI0016010BAA|nr:DUF885 family protein [Sphingomonas sp. So64.6b]QNA84327.1 DUF885 family protein [Sphingomonas sp. So64.6b]